MGGEGHLIFDQMHFSDWQGKFTIVHVDIQQLYVHSTKKSTRVSPVSPVFWKKNKNRADVAILIPGVVVSTPTDSTENSDACWLFDDEAVFTVQSFMLLAGQISEYRRIHPLF